MGYCIEMIDSSFKIKKENAQLALDSLKDFCRNNPYLKWVSNDTVIHSEDIVEAFDEIRYPLITDENGDYVIEYFSGEKYGNCENIFNSMAEYIEEGSYVDFEGEDGCKFRFLISNGMCKETKIPRKKKADEN